MTMIRMLPSVLVGLGLMLGSATWAQADAAVAAGNYQTHVPASTTRLTAEPSAAESRNRPAQNIAADANHVGVRAGNYQSHVLPSTTRRSVRPHLVDTNDAPEMAGNRATRD